MRGSTYVLNRNYFSSGNILSLLPLMWIVKKNSRYCLHNRPLCSHLSPTLPRPPTVVFPQWVLIALAQIFAARPASSRNNATRVCFATHKTGHTNPCPLRDLRSQVKSESFLNPLICDHRNIGFLRHRRFRWQRKKKGKPSFNKLPLVLRGALQPPSNAPSYPW